MIIAIVQAKLGSIRLPEKVLKKVNEKTLIEILLHRLSLSKKIDKVILATSKSCENDALVELVEKLGIHVYRGSENNVLDRYYQATQVHQPTTVVRITGDCPIIDPELVDEVIGLYQENNVDYVSNTEKATFPDGLDIEVFSFKALGMAHKYAENPFEREHVTPFIRNNKKFKRMIYTNEKDLSGERWTVDEPEDFEVIENIVNHF